MNKACLIAVWLLIAASSVAESTHQRLPQFDLSKLGMVVNGQQICNDTGNRLQDFPSLVADQIIVAGPKAVPILIGMIADRHMAHTREPLICYWPGMAIGDIAFCLLGDMFMDPERKMTVPGADWNDLLSPVNSGAAWEQLHGFIRKYRSAALQVRWLRVWTQYRSQVLWDSKRKVLQTEG